MRLQSLTLTNYRTLQDVQIDFPGYYATISGRNDAGKSNLVRALRCLLGDSDPFAPPARPTLSDDYPRWKDKQENPDIRLEGTFLIDQGADAGLHTFLMKLLNLDDSPEHSCIQVKLGIRVNQDGVTPLLEVNESTFDEVQADYVLDKFRTSGVALFHNSAVPDPRFSFFPASTSFLGELTADEHQRLESKTSRLNLALSRLARRHQKDIEELVGRLERKHSVGLSFRELSFENIPFKMTLGDKDMQVGLDEWGSGTQNRTQILLTLLRARKISQSGASAKKVTPILIIEEPESFLHPSAQAQFGRVLQDLASALEIQIVATTHSPFMLNQAEPRSNILLERRTEYRKLRQTTVVEISNENWMAPFGEILGISDEEFEPWRQLFNTRSDQILLVEGEIDEEYFNILRGPEHGSNRLLLDGEIFPYKGKDNLLKNAPLLQFLIRRESTIYVTYDMDAEKKAEKFLGGLGLQPRIDFLALGLNKPGKREIEGLLPERVLREVNDQYSGLVQQVMSGTSEEKKSAKSALKARYLEHFKKTCKAGTDDFKHFYVAVKVINKGLERQ